MSEHNIQTVNEVSFFSPTKVKHWTDAKLRFSIFFFSILQSHENHESRSLNIKPFRGSYLLYVHVLHVYTHTMHYERNQTIRFIPNEERKIIKKNKFSLVLFVRFFYFYAIFEMIIMKLAQQIFKSPEQFLIRL